MSPASYLCLKCPWTSDDAVSNTASEREHFDALRAHLEQHHGKTLPHFDGDNGKPVVQ